MAGRWARARLWAMVGKCHSISLLIFNAQFQRQYYDNNAQVLHRIIVISINLSQFYKFYDLLYLLSLLFQGKLSS